MSIEVYIQPSCPFCRRALALFKEKGVEVKEILALHGMPTREEARQRSGGRTTVPQIFIDGRSIGGCDELIALDKSGELDKLLEQSRQGRS